jgi:hypothetical protein
MRSPIASRYPIGIDPGRCRIQLMQRLASMTPGATIASVGQSSMHRSHDPQPSGAGPGVG